jgi:hypothetical protein
VLIKEDLCVFQENASIRKSKREKIEKKDKDSSRPRKIESEGKSFVK